MLELAAATTVLAGIAAADRPLPAQADDGNEWVSGDCWFYCGRRGLPVLWLGPATSPGGLTAPLYACTECIAQINDRIWEYAGTRDVRVMPARGRHARPRPRRPFWRIPALDREEAR
ncbi:hypothetical protein ATKI12_5790 [Kitasatospora sp. Ki12]